MKTVMRTFILALSFMLITLSSILWLALDSSPKLVASSPQQLEKAESVQDLLAQLKATMRKRHLAQHLSLSEAQLNSLTGFAQRAVPEFHAKVEIAPSASVMTISYQLPHILNSQYLNMHIVLLPGDGLALGDMQIGALSLPGSWVVNSLVALVDWWSHSDIASQTVAQVKQVRMSHDSIYLSLAPIDGLLRQLSAIRDDFAVKDNDPLRIRTAYYLHYLDKLPLDSRYAEQSLVAYLSPLMRQAASRSVHNPAWLENEAALLALAIYAGHHRFAGFIGHVQPQPGRVAIPKYRPLLAARSDLCQHFIYSAAINILSRQGISAAIGEFKELMDRNARGSGYSFVDLAADMAGVKLAQAAVDPSSASKVQTMLALNSSESLFFPAINGLPEGLTKANFIELYGQVDSPAYLAMLAEIESRLAQLPLYRSQPASATASFQ